MRHRSVELLENLRTIELPVLPFLAPRAFEPWPSLLRSPQPGRKSSPSRFAKPCTVYLNTSASNYNQYAWRSTSSRVLGRRWQELDHTRNERCLNKRAYHRTRPDHQDLSTFGNLFKGPSAVNSEHGDQQKLPKSEPKKAQTQSIDDNRGAIHIAIPWRQYSGPPTISKAFEDFETGLSSLDEHQTKRPATSTDVSSSFEHFRRKVAEKSDKAKRSRAQYFDDLRRRERLHKGINAHKAREEGYTKYVVLQPVREVVDADGPERLQIERFSTIWTTNFAIIANKYDDMVGRSDADFNIHHLSRVWAQRILQCDTLAGMKGEWLRRKRRSRLITWPHAMLWVLHHAPADALRFLVATSTDPFPSGQQVADVLDIVARLYSQCEVEYRKSLRQKYFVAFRVLVHRSKAPTFPASQRTLLFLFKDCKAEDLPMVYNWLVNNNIHFHANTQLQLAYLYASNGYFSRSMDVLSEAAGAGANTGSAAFLSVCVKLLDGVTDGQNAYQTGTRTIEFFFRLGVRLNIAMYNIMMQHAAKAEDYETVWHICDMLREHNVGLDSHSYTILMAVCRRTKDVDRLENVVERIHGEIENRHFATELMFSTANLYRARGMQQYQPVLDLYRATFNPQPLNDLRITNERSPGQVQKPQPTTAALGLIISLYINASSSVTPVHALYRKFQHLRNEGHPAIISLAATEHTYNAFLMRFARTSSPRIWFKLLRDMPRPMPKSPTATGTDERLDGCRPTFRTWSIILNAFARKGLLTDAEKTLKLMTKRGMDTNHAWNSLVRWYARRQDAKLIGLFKRIASHGVIMDEQTVKAVLNFRDRAALSQGLQEVKWLSLMKQVKEVEEPIQREAGVSPTGKSG